MSADERVEIGEVTRLLRDVRGGDADARERLFALIYDDLRGIARRQLRREMYSRTIEPTALIHEAYLKMVGGVSAPIDAGDRAHLLSLAARAMRQVLVDQARRRIAAKRVDGWNRVTLSDAGPADGLGADELLALNDALERLDERQRCIVESRYFGGMEEREIAEALGITERTVRRDWVKARAWLNHALQGTA
jgi:RNA polymerase sigma factor (TIGR02999 family)